ncbi:MAG: PAS domain-containing sensor histidine kinase, partial [Actinobacteria bacterium]|nr:PAS domain-containing sensor histidine kinase [Actinomycetota bacterium]
LAAAKEIDLDDDETSFTSEHLAIVAPPVDPRASRHLKRLVAGWGMLADFAFADLLLYVALPSHDAGLNRFLVVNQVRPNTGQTLFLDDVVGRTMSSTQRPLVAQAMATGEISEDVVDSQWLGERIRVTAIPVRFEGRVVAVLVREASLEGARDVSDLASVYLGVFRRLGRMVADGVFPFADEEVVATGGPRVGDGVLLLDELGRVAFASPNAVSAVRRLGIQRRLQGEHLSELGAETAASYRAYFNGRPTVEEVERDDVTIVLRCIPLIADGHVDGAVVLLRDVSEMRLRDRALVSKDATIKEIHHRVKNNLQTISSLLRLQGRRLIEPSAKAAIEESVRRIRSIALVHETLSREDGDDVDFGDVVRPLVRMVEEGLTSPEVPLEFVIEGGAGKLPSPEATSLAVVTTELLQNVVDHAYPPGTLDRGQRGRIRIVMTNDSVVLRLAVVDDGAGIPSDFDPLTSDSLGMTIVRGLVDELGGTIEQHAVQPGARRPGNRVQLALPVVSHVESDAQRPPRGGGRSVGL